MLFRSYGLTEEQARQLLLEVPQLYGRVLGAPVMKAKLRYYQEVFGRDPLEMLLHKRDYLKEGLAKVDLWVRNWPDPMCFESRARMGSSTMLLHHHSCLAVTVYPNCLGMPL